MKERFFQVGVKAFIKDSKGRVLLLKATPDRADGRWPVHWDIPGGRITNQGITETLKRELDEETGIKRFKVLGLRDAAISNYFKMHPRYGKPGLMLLIFDCEIPAGSRIKLSEEHDDYKWATMKEAKKLLSFKYPKIFLDKL